MLGARLQNQEGQVRYIESGYIYRKSFASPAVMDELASEMTASMLDRIRLMRVFDISGMVEAITEVGDEWERHTSLVGEQSKVGKAEQRQSIVDSEEDVEEQIPLDTEKLQRPGQSMIKTESRCMIVIDTITNVVEAAMSQSRIQGISGFQFSDPHKMCVNLS